MKAILRRVSQKAAQSISRNICLQLPTQSDPESLNQQIQLSIKNQWLQWRAAGSSPYNKIQEAGFRCYSQFEEDGIILYLLTMLGISCGTAIEMCCGTGDECMTTNLILNHGFKAYLFDGSQANIDAATNYFRAKKDCLLVKPELKCSWITTDNVNDLLRDLGCPEDVDFFSLDIDGNDYWVWEAISDIRPKICCFETHDIIPSDRSITIPYNPNFNCWSQPLDHQDFRSVSLAAMAKLSRAKGYRLIGSHRHGFNAFFMRNDVGQSFFPEVSVSDIHDNPWSRYGQDKRWQLVKDLGWIEV
ncbi:MAG: hypothetical protein RLZZ206_1129 [Cyanobacteriota bacterium]|jgi:hypothetical protein